MELNALTALSPLDGRYRRSGAKLAPYFSEFGLIKYRVQVEIEWLKALAAEKGIKEVPAFSAKTVAELDAIVSNFSLADAEAVKTHEKVTNHDVKAVEYFLKDKTAGNAEVTKVSEFIHFACTSEDINNLSHALMLRDARARDVLLPALEQVIAKLHRDWRMRTPTCPCCRAPTASRHADHPGQGDGQRRLPPAPRQRRRIAAVELTWARSTARSATTTPTCAAYPEVDWAGLRRGLRRMAWA
jgi:adenylosuccinate lyase